MSRFIFLLHVDVYILLLVWMFLSLKNVEVYNHPLLLRFAMFTFTAYQHQPILVSNYCGNLSRFSVSLLFPTTYHFWRIRLNFSPWPICQRNRKCLLLWHICQWLRLETRWVLVLTQKQFFSRQRGRITGSAQPKPLLCMDESPWYEQTLLIIKLNNLQNPWET